eukprot:4752168-Lingulodinium_polyedra.AAC.1
MSAFARRWGIYCPAPVLRVRRRAFVLGFGMRFARRASRAVRMLTIAASLAAPAPCEGMIHYICQSPES